MSAACRERSPALTQTTHDGNSDPAIAVSLLTARAARVAYSQSIIIVAGFDLSALCRAGVNVGTEL